MLHIQYSVHTLRNKARKDSTKKVKLLTTAGSKITCCCVALLSIPRTHGYLITKVIHPSLRVGLALHGTRQLLWECVTHIFVLWLIAHAAVVSTDVMTY